MSREITGYYAIGGGLLDGKALQNALGTPDAYPIDQVHYAATGGGLFWAGRSGPGYGLEGQAIIDQDAGDGYETAIGMGYGLFNMGYGFRLGPLRIFPMVGVGGGGIGFDITRQHTPNAAPQRASRTNFLVHLGIGVEFRMGGRLGVAVGGRFGWLFAPFSRREGIRGPYFRVFFGGGARV